MFANITDPGSGSVQGSSKITAITKNFATKFATNSDPRAGTTKDDFSQRFLTVREVADRLKVSRATVYSLLASGQLRHHRVSHAIRVPESALDDFLNQAKAR